MHSLLLALSVLSASAAQPQAYQGVLLDFSATWCGPCQQMSPLVERLHRQGYPIRKVDVDQEAELARKFNVTSIPAFVLVVNGKEVTRSVGGQSETALKQMMARIPREAPPQDETQVAGNQPAAPPRRGLLPRIKLPLFDGKADTPRLGPGDEAVIRANNDDPPPAATAPPGNDPLSASTRIQIKDEQGTNYGSGTIIDSVPGRAVVLTCGHIFRNLPEDAVIEVDVFHGGRATRYVGTLLRHDLEADVGLITINADVALPTAPVAAAETQLAPNDPVFSIGCGGGEDPSRQNIRVSRLNPYLGPDNVECTGVPVQGRSGGGLFNQQGEVVGVCVAADPKQKRGLYAGLKAILDLLQPPAEPAQLAAEGELAEAAGRANTSPFGHSEEPASADPGAAAPGEIPAELAAQLPADAAGAEVICIIRSHDNPRAASRVVIINRASSKFLSYLRGEVDEQPLPTSGRVTTLNEDPAASRGEERSRQAAGGFAPPRVVPVEEAFSRNSAPAAETASRWRAPAQPLPEESAAAPPQKYRRSAASRR